MPLLRLAGSCLVILPLTLLSACNTTGPAASAPPAVAAATAAAGCAGEVSAYRAVMENDRTTGHVAESVYRRVEGEIERAAEACAAGRDAEAVRMLNATKARYGYV